MYSDVRVSMENGIEPPCQSFITLLFAPMSVKVSTYIILRMLMWEISVVEEYDLGVAF